MIIVYSGLILFTIGGILGVSLAIASVVFHVEQDLRIEIVNDMLPGYNCGACGCPGCMGMAEKLVENTINLKACKPAKEEELLKIKEYLHNTLGPDGSNVDVEM